MLVDEVKSVFAAWKAQDLLAAGIEFRESSNPTFDPNDDYRVIYEATFEPDNLEKARLEFWLTDTGHVAVGFETYERIIQRLELKAIRHGFAVGHEPRAVSKEGLQKLFDAVTLGKIFIAVRSTLRLATSARICMSESDCDAIERSGYRCSDWISPLSNDDAVSPSSSFGKILRYRAW
jgi:hypothetical protein